MSLFVEKANGSYNSRTFPKKRSEVWIGHGIHAVRTAEDVFQFKITDRKTELRLGDAVTLFSPNGKMILGGVIERFDFSTEVGDEERGHSVNCGVMVVGSVRTREATEQEMETAPSLRNQKTTHKTFI